MASVLKVSIVKGTSTLVDVTKSIECLIQDVKIEKLQTKLYCTYKSAKQSISLLPDELRQVGVTLSESEKLSASQRGILKTYSVQDHSSLSAPESSSSSTIPEEGTIVNTPVDLPVYSVDSADQAEQQLLDQQTDPYDLSGSNDLIDKAITTDKMAQVRQ